MLVLLKDLHPIAKGSSPKNDEEGKLRRVEQEFQPAGVGYQQREIQ
jgi:hypothetical protein